MTKRMMIALCGVLMAATAACGNDLGTSSTADGVDLSSEEAKFAKTLADAMAGQADSPIMADQATCWSRRLVSDFGIDRLNEVGLTPKTFSSDEGPGELTAFSKGEQDTFTDGFTECIDVVEMMLASAGTDTAVTPEMEKCFRNAVTEKTEVAFAQVLIQGDEASEDDPDLAAAMAPLMGCMFLGLGGDDNQTDVGGSDMSTTTTEQ